MHPFWALVLLSIALANALDSGLGVSLDKGTSLRFMRRDVPFSNTTLLLANDTSSTVTFASPVSTISSSTIATSSSSTSSDPTTTSATTLASSNLAFILPSTLATSTIGAINSQLNDSSTNTPPVSGPPKLPPVSYPFTNFSTSITLNLNASTPTCTGSVTYYGSVPPTIYVTVTEGFNVTVTASNVSATDTPTLITPLPACDATVVPLAASFNPEESLTTAAPGATNTLISPGNAPQIATINPDNNPAPTPPAAYSSVDYTSTVVVTKKTPVTVVAPPTTSPDVNFDIPSKTSTPSPGNGGSGSTGNSGGNGGGGGSGNTPAPNAPATSGGGGFPTLDNQGPTEGTLVVDTPTTTGIGNIIASILNSPFVTASPTLRPAAAAPLTTTVNNIPITVSSSNVVIGSQTVAIPNLIPTTIEASGVVFTVEPSQIIGPSGTITLSPQYEQIVTPAPTATITTVVDGLTLTVGPTAAIIAGTTYRVGQGASATTIVVDGTSISIGSGGVGLGSTTVAPGGVSPFLVYTAQGLTFSVDNSEAIVGGTTYRIGSNAPEITTTIGPQHVTVSFGPDGVGLASTTLVPGTALFSLYTVEGLTISVDGTEAIVDGTTYRIGSGAPQVKTTIGPDHVSVSFGPGGVGLDSTTIAPATASHTAATGSKSTFATASSTQSAGLSSGASPRFRLSLPAGCWIVLPFASLLFGALE